MPASHCSSSGKPRVSLLAFLSSAVVLLLVTPSIARSQQQQGAGTPVRMLVTAEPKHGDQLPPLARQDIIVMQGHDKRPVTDWVPASGSHAGLELALLIDDSSGFSLGTELNQLRDFINQQPSSTFIALGYMQNGTVDMLQNFSNDHAAVARAVRLPQGYWGAEASPYFSLSSLLKHWTQNPAAPRREVLMITSGIDTYYGGGMLDPYVDAAIRDSQCAGVPIFSIYTRPAGHLGHSYFLTNWGENYLSEIAEDTGGESYYILGPQSPVAFEPYLKKFSGQLNDQFLLTFLAKPDKKAGLQGVKLVTENHNVDLLAPKKVCVPASAGQ